MPNVEKFKDQPHCSEARWKNNTLHYFYMKIWMVDVRYSLFEFIVYLEFVHFILIFWNKAMRTKFLQLLSLNKYKLLLKYLHRA